MSLFSRSYRVVAARPRPSLAVPVTEPRQKKKASLLLFFFPKALALAAASTNLDTVLSGTNVI